MIRINLRNSYGLFWIAWALVVVLIFFFGSAAKGAEGAFSKETARPLIFGIFDAFPDEAGRQAHLAGRVAAALMANASELLAQPPTIEKVDILAAKLP
jgi:hypothetical protein